MESASSQKFITNADIFEVMTATVLSLPDFSCVKP